jgi:hypothetical protein
MRTFFNYIFGGGGKTCPCRTGPLRVGRPLRGGCTLCRRNEDHWSSRWSEAAFSGQQGALAFWSLEAGAYGVGCDGLIDLEGEGECGAASFSRNMRGGAGADGVEEGFDLEPERLALLDWNFFE